MTGNKIGGYAAGWDFVDFKVCKGVKKSNTERRQLNKRMRNSLKRDEAKMIKDAAQSSQLKELCIKKHFII